ncbi:MAG: hypothetical protein ACSNEK_05670 [Parachlamydiaceae bacterium]
MGLVSSSTPGYKKYLFVTPKERPGRLNRLVKNLHVLLYRICYFFKHGECLTRSLIVKKWNPSLNDKKSERSITEIGNLFRSSIYDPPKALSQVQASINDEDEKRGLLEQRFQELFQSPEKDAIFKQKLEFIQELDSDQIVDLISRLVEPSQANSIFAFCLNNHGAFAENQLQAFKNNIEGIVALLNCNASDHQYPQQFVNRVLSYVIEEVDVMSLEMFIADQLYRALQRHRAPEDFALIFSIEQLEQICLNLPAPELLQLSEQLRVAYSQLPWSELIDRLENKRVDQRIYQKKVESAFVKEVEELSIKQTVNVYRLMVGDAPNVIEFCKKLNNQQCYALLEAEPRAANEISFNEPFMDEMADRNWVAILSDLKDHSSQPIFCRRLLKRALVNKGLEGLEFSHLLLVSSKIVELKLSKKIFNQFLASLPSGIKLQFLSDQQIPLKVKSTIIKKMVFNSSEDMVEAIIELRKVNQSFANLGSLIYKYLDRFPDDLISEHLLPEEKETLKIYRLIQTKPVKNWIEALPKLTLSTHQQVINYLLEGNYSLNLKTWKSILGTIKESKYLHSLLSEYQLGEIALEAVSHWVVLKLKVSSCHLNTLEQTDALRTNISNLEKSASPIDRALSLLLTNQSQLIEEKASQGIHRLGVDEIYTLSDECAQKLLASQLEDLQKLDWTQLIAFLQKGLPLKLDLAKANLAALFKARKIEDINLLSYEQARYLFQILNTFKGDRVFGFYELKLILLNHLKGEIFAQLVSRRVVKSMSWIDLLPLLRRFQQDLDPESVLDLFKEKKLIGISLSNRKIANEILTILKKRLGQEKGIECEGLISKLSSVSSK